MDDNLVKKRHQFWFHVLKPIARLYTIFKFGYKVKNKYKIKKGESVVVLSNHQADLDPLFIELSFNKYLYPVASDHMFSSKTSQRLMHFFSAIPKRKGAFDIKSTMMMKKTIQKGGSLLLFPEGNRSYAEFQFNIDDSIAKMRYYNCPIVLFNLHGGTGINPRFGKKFRKGKIYGEIKLIITPEEYENMSDKELANVIRDNLKVFDSDSGEKYKSNSRAEYIEREFFVCPKCGKKETLVSKGNFVTCSNCGLTVEYTEDLHLKSDDPEFKFNRMLDWYNYQKEWVKNYEIKDENEVIFSDDNVALSIRNPSKPIINVTKGTIKLTKNYLYVGEEKFLVKEISVISPLKGDKLLFTVNDNAYFVQGHDRFNPLKYVLMINKLDSKVKELGIDKMFAIE